MPVHNKYAITPDYICQHFESVLYNHLITEVFDVKFLALRKKFPKRK